MTFNNKANDVSLRVSAIDYLGVVAAHLRKDAVNSQQDTESITEILVEVNKLQMLRHDTRNDSSLNSRVKIYFECTLNPQALLMGITLRQTP